MGGFLDWISRNSERTLARLSLGPLFWGIALYVNARPPFAQFWHCAAFLAAWHLTLRRSGSVFIFSKFFLKFCVSMRKFVSSFDFFDSVSG